jgi:hypothetical protein
MVKPYLLPLVACALWGCGNEDPSAPGSDSAPIQRDAGPSTPSEAGRPDPGQPLPTQVTLDLGGARMVVDARNGARITELSIAGVNVLSGPEINRQNFGSTFWPSPQSLWNWPPLWQFDTAQYAGGVDPSTGTLRLVSDAAPMPLAEGFPKLRITKAFVPLPELNAVDVTYTIANASTNGEPAVTTAPWQVTRVRGVGGLTFFAKGEGSVNAAKELPLIEQAGLLWFPFAPASGDAKTFADAKGWVAHVTPKRLLLVLRFEDISPSDSPGGDAELELYTGLPSQTGDYLEIEPQGKKKTLAAGDSLTWTVRFLVRTLPADITPAVGDPALIAYVETVK